MGIHLVIQKYKGQSPTKATMHAGHESYDLNMYCAVLQSSEPLEPTCAALCVLPLRYDMVDNVLEQHFFGCS
jgi:hypothetical protein